VLILLEETGKNQLQSDQVSMEDSPVLSLFFAEKSLTKVTGVLEHSREAETKGWFSIFRDISF